MSNRLSYMIFSPVLTKRRQSWTSLLLATVLYHILFLPIHSNSYAQCSWGLHMCTEVIRLPLEICNHM